MYAARATARSLKAATPNIDRSNNQSVHVAGQPLTVGPNQTPRICPDSRAKLSNTARLIAIGGQFGPNGIPTPSNRYRPSNTAVVPVRQPRPTASPNNYYNYSAPTETDPRVVNQPYNCNITNETSHSYHGDESSSRPFNNDDQAFITPLAVGHGSFPFHQTTTPCTSSYMSPQEDISGRDGGFAPRQNNATNSRSMGGYLHAPTSINEVPQNPARMGPKKSQATRSNMTPTDHLYDNKSWLERSTLLADTDNSYPVPNSRTFVPHGALPQGHPSFQVRYSSDTEAFQQNLPRANPANAPMSSSTPLTRSTCSGPHVSAPSTISALKCPQCGIDVSSAKDVNHRKSNLSRHMRVEHGDHSRVGCPEVGCGKTYKRSDALQKHRRIEHSRQH